MREYLNSGRGEEAVAFGECQDAPDLIMQWSEKYWDFYVSTNQNVKLSFDEALEHPQYQDIAEAMLARANDTVRLILNVRAQKIGAAVVDAEPINTGEAHELKAA